MYKMQSRGWTKHYDFMLLDLLCLHLAFVAAFMLRHGFRTPYTEPLYRNMAIFLTFADFAVFYLFETLGGVLKRGYYREFAATLRHTVILFLLAVLYLFSVQESFYYSRLTLFFTAAIYLILTYGVRLWRKYAIFHSKSGKRSRSMLIVTDSGSAGDVVGRLLRSNYGQFNYCGVAVTDKDMQGESFEGVPVVSCVDKLEDYVRTEWVDEVFIALPRGADYPEELVRDLVMMGVTVHERMESLGDTLGKKQFFEKIGDFNVLTTGINYATSLQLLGKRTMDVVGGILGCIATGLLFPILAPMIFFSSPGPVIFSQERVGKNGKKFKMYKFRTMYPDAESRKKELMAQNRIDDERMFKLDFDPRIIGNRVLPDGTVKRGVGAWIRRLSLDEFPQFFNVLRGDMSLVGTRPPTVDEWEKYELHHRARLAIKPGITGMWQVSGRSNITDFEEVVRLDTEYIKQWNLGMDIKILLKTFAVVFKKEGSL